MHSHLHMRSTCATHIIFDLIIETKYLMTDSQFIYGHCLNFTDYMTLDEMERCW
jgi:hypothetical protein